MGYRIMRAYGWVDGYEKRVQVWMAYCLVVYYADPDSGSHE